MPDGTKMEVIFAERCGDGKIKLGFAGPRSLQVVRANAKKKAPPAAAPCFVCLGTGEVPTHGDGNEPCPECSPLGEPLAEAMENMRAAVANVTKGTR
jgi:hypothetical protein